MQRRATWAMIESRDLTIKYLDERIIRQQTEIEQLRIENARLRGENNGMEELVAAVHATLSSGRTTGRNLEQAAVDAENIIIAWQNA